jgi:hypothetical protein
MSAFYAFPGIKNSLRRWVEALRVMAPFARQGTPFEENRRPNPRPIVNTITHYIEDNSFFQNYLRLLHYAKQAKNTRFEPLTDIPDGAILIMMRMAIYAMDSKLLRSGQ